MMEKLHSLNNFDPTLPISSRRGLNCNLDQYFLEPISSMVSSLTPSSSVFSNDTFTLPELIENFPLHSHPGQSKLGTSLPLTSSLADPGFAERAAKYSCFGSKSFNGRTDLLSSYPLMGNGELPRVSSSHVLEQSVRENQIKMKKLSKFCGSVVNSDEVSTINEQISSRVNSSNRKLVSRGKEGSSTSSKGLGGDEVGNAKRLKPTKNGKCENIGAKTEKEETKGGSSEKPLTESPKDYIYVRAVRGQATDSHSLAERVRREKISERMKFLQDLVPTCKKVTGKALMLDEIINYVQSLQQQVEFLSMKLASVNPELEFNMENLLQNQEMYPLDSSAPTLIYNHDQSQQNLQLHHQNIGSRLFSNFGIESPYVHGSSENLPQFHAFGGDDLHNIFQTGFDQNSLNFLDQNVRN